MRVDINIVDVWNPLKVHMFRKYRDGHITYNQAIAGSVFYKRFTRINKQSPVYGVLKSHENN